MLCNKQEREVSGGFFRLVDLISSCAFEISYLWSRGSILSGEANGCVCPGGSTVGVQSWFKAGWARAVCAQHLINLPSACPAAAIPAHAWISAEMPPSRRWAGSPRPSCCWKPCLVQQEQVGKGLCSQERSSQLSCMGCSRCVSPLSFPEGVPWGEGFGSRLHPDTSPRCCPRASGMLIVLVPPS